MDVLNSALSGVATALKVPDRASGLAKVEHAVLLFLAAKTAHSLYKLGPRGAFEGAVSSVMGVVKAVPGLSGVVEAEKAKIISEIEDFVLGDNEDTEPHREIPQEGLPRDAVISRLEELRGREKKFNNMRAAGGIYHVEGDDLWEIQNRATALYNCSNALYPGVFTGVRKFEAEVVRMLVTMLRGDDTACGTLTSGGTESVLLAVYAYRGLAQQRGIAAPEIVAGKSAHAALDKAGKYFGVKIVHVDLAEDCSMDLAATEAACNSNTIAIYTSAPTFPHGTIDNIPAICEIAKRRGVPGVHVDNCLGGFITSSMAALGLLDKKFDFSVPGVTSISVDVHKYGLSPKGVSSVLYRTPELRALQYCAVTDWPGGLYCTPTMQGSRSGAVMAGAWATIMFKGVKGYQEFARKCHAVLQRIKKEISETEGLEILGAADACVVAYTSNTFNIYKFADAMSHRGWEVPRLQRPPAIHFCVSETSELIVDEYLKDVRECAAICRDDPGKVGEGMAGIYGMAGSMPDRGMVADILGSYMDVLYKVPDAPSGAAGGAGSA